jgi:hypothetical protein
MPIKQLRKTDPSEKLIEQFASKADGAKQEDGYRHILLRVPICLIEKVDAKIKERIHKVSRNHWIVENLEKALTEE